MLNIDTKARLVQKAKSFASMSSNVYIFCIFGHDLTTLDDLYTKFHCFNEVFCIEEEKGWYC